MKTFGNAIKNGQLLANTETVVHEHTISSGASGAVITEQWFTGVICDNNTRVRYYFDGETVPSLDFMLYMAHGLGFDPAKMNTITPWGTKRIGQTATKGGLYNTYRIPFQKSVRVTVENPSNGTYWYILRGVEDYPVIIGDLELPSTARLQLFKTDNVLLKPLEYITIGNVTNSAGMLYQVTLAAQSTDPNFLEACFRAHIDGNPDPLWLSSGT
jgi:D-arabinan exo alpha-(1,3)/(1,5)-arabinofuranosidase (non-reducing end)